MNITEIEQIIKQLRNEIMAIRYGAQAEERALTSEELREINGNIDKITELNEMRCILFGII